MDGSNGETALSARLRERHGTAVEPLLRGYRVEADSTVLLRLGFDPTTAIDAEVLTNAVAQDECVEGASFVTSGDGEAGPTAEDDAQLLAVYVADGASDPDEIALRAIEALSRVLLERYRAHAQRGLLSDDG